MILNHDLITTANPLRELVAKMAELGHHVDSATDESVPAWRRDREYPALVNFAHKMAAQYADDAHNQHRYLARAGLDAEAHPGALDPHHRALPDPPPGVPAEVACDLDGGERHVADYIGDGEEGQPLYTCRSCRITFTTEHDPDPDGAGRCRACEQPIRRAGRFWEHVPSAGVTA
jgi:hypothetical protein